MKNSANQVRSKEHVEFAQRQVCPVLSADIIALSLGKLLELKPLSMSRSNEICLWDTVGLVLEQSLIVIAFGKWY